MHPDRWHIRFLATLLFGVWGMAGQAQVLKFVHLNESDGLPSMEVYGIHCDKKGYIWAFTEYGIVRHNGERFFGSGLGLPFEKSTVYAHYESPEGKLYIVNSKGEFYYLRKDTAIAMMSSRRYTYKPIDMPIYQLYAQSDSIVYSTNTYNLCYRTNLLRDSVAQFLSDSVFRDTLRFVEHQDCMVPTQLLVAPIHDIRKTQMLKPVTIAIYSGRSNPWTYTVPIPPNCHLVRTHLKRKGPYLFLSLSNTYTLSTPIRVSARPLVFRALFSASKSTSISIFG